MVWYGMEVAPSSDHFSSHHQPISAPKLSSNTYSSHILCILKQTLFMVFFISQPISSPQRTKVLHPSYTAPKRRKVNFVRRQIHFLDWSCFVFSPAPLPPNHASITSPAQIMASALQRRFSRKGAAGAQASLCLAALLRAQSERACFVSKQLNCSPERSRSCFYSRSRCLNVSLLSSQRCTLVIFLFKLVCQFENTRRLLWSIDGN